MIKRAGNLVFASGRLASDDRTGVAPEARIDPAFPYYGSAVKRQTRYILQMLKAELEEAGSSLARVVKAHVFHLRFAQFRRVRRGLARVLSDAAAMPGDRGYRGAVGAWVPA